ncbi:MAG TPA: hypothetical protein VI953_02445, partial [Candidatus Paceibacterota bacterium]
ERTNNRVPSAVAEREMRESAITGTQTGVQVAAKASMGPHHVPNAVRESRGHDKGEAKLASPRKENAFYECFLLSN